MVGSVGARCKGNTGVSYAIGRKYSDETAT